MFSPACVYVLAYKQDPAPNIPLIRRKTAERGSGNFCPLACTGWAACMHLNSHQWDHLHIPGHHHFQIFFPNEEWTRSSHTMFFWPKHGWLWPGLSVYYFRVWLFFFEISRFWNFPFLKFFGIFGFSNKKIEEKKFCIWFQSDFGIRHTLVLLHLVAPGNRYICLQ